jgi:hypothetical protein
MKMMFGLSDARREILSIRSSGILEMIFMRAVQGHVLGAY